MHYYNIFWGGIRTLVVEPEKKCVFQPLHIDSKYSWVYDQFLG